MPPEVWSRICREAVIRTVDTPVVAHLEPHKNEDSVRQPAITRTCRQIRAETLPTYYSNLFSYYPAFVHKRDARDMEPLIQWLTSIGPANRQHIARLSIVVFHLLGTADSFVSWIRNLLAPLGYDARDELRVQHIWTMLDIVYVKH
ncbi:hypothetical protein BAUCODRAFT_253443 [Baudoinia panamericana UAMH 10762]|uniref:Uncharacterized protein n=1 Tax=Baudoinia panamericana (strain UAMH 10762) TaxID=717646 RepID=M2MQE3_BAUPA|nr:uncharacterized protein BAUCODRAFT_253443 [Baudoinia panamericana UAMH 10762]EMC93703.1 hypothetical protein BAUCODRAFT_253443 [Baudoinia panamericana UAMH 10762]